MTKKQFMNFDGTLLWKDIPILDFSIVDGECSSWHMHEENKKYYPFVFKYQPNLKGLNLFVSSRLVPETRQNIEKVLKDLGLTEYTCDGIVKANYGLCTDDCYWFRQTGSSLKYDDVKIRD